MELFNPKIKKFLIFFQKRFFLYFRKWNFLAQRVTLNRLGGGCQFDPPLCGFSENVSSKERMKPWFFVTFNIIISHIFHEHFIETSQVLQKL